MSKPDPTHALVTRHQRANARQRGKLRRGWVACLRCGFGLERGDLGYDGLHAECRKKKAREVMR